MRGSLVVTRIAPRDREAGPDPEAHARQRLRGDAPARPTAARSIHACYTPSSGPTTRHRGHCRYQLRRAHRGAVR
jgi:hypothetical protein